MEKARAITLKPVSGWHMMRIAIDSIVGNQDMPIATVARKCRAVTNATIIEAWTQVNVGNQRKGGKDQ